MRNSTRLSLFVPFIFLLLFLLCFSATALAAETGPQWTVTGVSAPTNFTPGNASGEDAYRVQVTNTGGAREQRGTGHDLRQLAGRSGAGVVGASVLTCA